MDGRLRLNGAVYSMKWDDIQLGWFDPDISLLGLVDNIGEASSIGFEILQYNSLIFFDLLTSLTNGDSYNLYSCDSGCEIDMIDDDSLSNFYGFTCEVEILLIFFFDLLRSLIFDFLESLS